MAERYNFSLTTFSPSGKLVQIEYALNAVQQGITSIAVKGKNGAVLVTERKTATPLIDEETVERITMICSKVGAVYSGMGPDARVLVLKARKKAMAYRRQFGEDPSAAVIVKEIAKEMQEYTQSGGVRPFGVSLLVIGFDCDEGKYEPMVYQVDPSGASWAWKATAIGKNSVSARAFLEKRYAAAETDLFEVEDAVHLGLLALKDGFEGQMTSENVQVGILQADCQFRLLDRSELADYLQSI